MIPRFYTNAISNATRTIAAAVFITGLVLIGFGFMIYLLPKFFATLAAIVFFVAGVGCALTAVKIFLRLTKLNKFSDPQAGSEVRKNVRIHTNGRREV